MRLSTTKKGIFIIHLLPNIGETKKPITRMSFLNQLYILLNFDEFDYRHSIVLGIDIKFIYEVAFFQYFVCPSF